MKNLFVDIHAHIIPNVDDGAKNMEESMSMLHMSYDEGVRTIIATPHYGMEEFNPKPDECAKLVEELNEKISQDETLAGMKVLLGNELLYRNDISQDVKNGLAKTLADTNYVLVEFYLDTQFPALEACAKEMKMAGYTPIFAHVERYFCLMDDLSKFDKLKELDVKFQVNAIELTEPPVEEEKPTKKTLFRREVFDFDAERKRLAWKYVLADKIDIIASDAHNTETRKPVMKTALDNIRAAGGDEIADKLIQNAQDLLK